MSVLSVEKVSEIKQSIEAKTDEILAARTLALESKAKSDQILTSAISNSDDTSLLTAL